MNKPFAILAVIAYFFALPAEAHVGYVIAPEKIAARAGADWSFILSAADQPINLFLMIFAIFAVFSVAWLFRKNRWLRHEADRVWGKASAYREFIPWILRLSLGIALIGAGTSQVFISPLVAEPIAGVIFTQIFLGFLLLAGFLLAPAALAAILLYFLALKYNFYLLGNLDFLGLALAFFVIGSARPGVDDLVGLPFPSPFRNLRKYVPLILRLGIGGAMIFLALYEKILNPHLARLVVTEYSLTSIIAVSPAMWVLGAGLIELLIGLFLLLGFKTRSLTVVAFLTLTLSFFFFKESVTSHITLFGALSALLITGGGKISIDAYYGPRKET